MNCIKEKFISPNTQCEKNMNIKLFFVLTAIAVVESAHPSVENLNSLNEDEVEKRLQTVFDNYFINNDETDLRAISNQLQMPDLVPFFGKPSVGTRGIGSALTCTACRTAISSLITARKLGAGTDLLGGLLAKLCSILGIQTSTVCNGVIDLNMDILIYILDNGNDISGKWICSVVLQSKDCETVDDKDWTIELDDQISAELEETTSSETINVIQLTDFHYDEMYNPGSNANCDNPICCGSDSGDVSDPSDAAGYWGDYRQCDTPWHTIVNALDNVKNNHNISYVYFTGDIISHRIWMTSQVNNSNYLKMGYDLIDEYFSEYPIFPLFGNHEPNPCNLYPPEDVEDFSNEWLYELAKEKWSKWLPESTYSTILKGGYYTVKVNDKFRIIALNSNVAYILNFWLLYNNTDYTGQLAWLRDTLAEAEKNGESVHILSHVPTGLSDSYKVWAREFRRIINRYANNIKAIFNGHTHYNEFQLFYNLSDSSSATVMAYNGGSISTYENLNPNYVVYEADSGNMGITDFHTYIFNLTAANANGDSNPVWYKLYSFKDAYGLQDLSRESLNKLVQELASSKSLARSYYYNKYKHSDPFMEEELNDDTLLTELCDTVSSLYGDDTQCDIITKLWASASD